MERLRKIPQQVLAWWNKFNAKQKTIIISVAAGVILTLAILVTILTRPQYEVLITCESTKEASEIIDLLDEDGIEYEVTDDGLIVSVKKEDISTATLLLGANNYPADSYSLDAALGGEFSTTESDKQKTYKLYQEGHLEEIMEAQSAVRAAYVTLSIPDDDGTLLATEEESYASVMLDLNEDLQVGVAENFAKNIATALGNKTTDNITIIDSNGNLLFSGADSSETESSIVNTSNQIALKSEAERIVKQEVTQVLLGSNLYEDVKVAPNLVMDFSAVNETEHTYTQADENGQNVLSHEETYESEGTNGSGGVPGTDTNTEEQTYVTDTGSNTTSSVTQESRDYLPGEKITDKTVPPGAIQYDTSSIAITASHYVIYKESEVKAQGLLDGITFEEFMQQNSDMVKKDVDEEMITLVANATGIPSTNISIIAYDVPIFQANDGSGLKLADIAQILLILLILGLLGFVVFSGLRKEKKATEPEAELSVESLLQSTQEHQEIEDIDLESKSEVRVMVEKFVDENPDAAAALLRNWLNEEWG
ncbi:MAG TPA: flagellar M-ring protein FliF C-terminal domain-containing protein [Lachnospiraceae bacterium]|nr:flagellar M-ring protein FliF C-terminal domain-containing protein [Lachnospiraceae bacterium]